ncbi:SH3 type 3 -containing domain protein [Brucella suis]|nr:hypothetical protein C062_01743 [Brucella suis 92/29]ENR23817.1 hypothetical protein C050_01868 [Brucella suis 92/63]ENR26270.1 hypothetical protein C978_01874 [Brucella suis 94/11]ENR29134.1 hypothetical protein C965_01750 [Brucella suis CNGB 786]ENR35362.1 hypothetical protein C977_00302 [Brucella suis F4/06-146]ENR37067.1 hypothetical protein C006_00017 [Brucella suis F5/03-2]ENR41206.1 hypothetical protein C063_01849 [Brucella suis F8/06-2]ENT27523.1 hypothetical protein B985_01620 [B
MGPHFGGFGHGFGGGYRGMHLGNMRSLHAGR